MCWYQKGKTIDGKLALREEWRKLDPWWPEVDEWLPMQKKRERKRGLEEIWGKDRKVHTAGHCDIVCQFHLSNNAQETLRSITS